MVLSHLVKISSKQQHQSERMFAIVRISVGAVTADTANKTAKRCSGLVKMLWKNISFQKSRLFLLVNGYDRNLLSDDR